MPYLLSARERLTWTHSFWTERYFNREEGRLVRETRKLRLPIPSPLNGSMAKA